MDKIGFRYFLLILFCFSFFQLSAQCMYHPITLEERVQNAKEIVSGKITSSHSYWDFEHKNIYTLYRFKVNAWFKGTRRDQEIGVISMGGIVGEDGQETYPTVRLSEYNEYILFLEGDNAKIDDRLVRIFEPGLMQTLLYADQQGALTYQFGVYHDHMSQFPPKSEAEMFSVLSSLIGKSPRSPGKSVIIPRAYSPQTPLSGKSQTPITSFAPDPTNGGTIVAGDQLAIQGAGFGAGAGTVFFSNADDGGATFTASGVATDIISWTATDILVKPAQRAGTGPININGAMTSATSLTIDYAHICINSSFSGFGVSTRQRYYHRDMNGLGGYSFLYNTGSGFAANAPAVAAFERALATWRCATYMNFSSAGNTASGFAADGINVVNFDGTLPVGVLGRATSRFSGGATGGCSLANTVWCVNEIDVQFFTDPPTGCCSWNYGPAAPGFLQYDLESVAVHELGHGHGLGHRIAPASVMHFSISNGASIRSPDATEIAGGNARVAYSTAATCFNPAACGSGPMVAIPIGACILPLETTDLEGIYLPDIGNQLTWNLFSESALTGFTVERSNNGIQFSQIGNVEVRANGGYPEKYEFIDNSFPLPLQAFYRLKTRNQNGEAAYSETIEINLQKNPLVLLNQGFERGEVNVIVPEEENISFTLLDLRGRKLFSTQLSKGKHLLPTSNLPNGIYLYSATNSTRSTQGKLLLRR